jgi:3-oxoacyl-(acyl-carrier-protein) synthase
LAALVVHWDGKLLPDLTGKELIDRLPVIVSGAGVNHLLGVPKLPADSGEAQASAVAQALEEWGLYDRVSAMCFDTTSSNTGRVNGSCVLLEQKLGKDLMYLA